jgi:GH15 family glucan-1,4-alpha-glucosidase
MPRSIVIGNGRVLVNYDAAYALRDLYFPRVGQDNQTMGNLCRTGFWVDGRFAWVSDPAWERRLAYQDDTMVTDVTLKHAGLGIEVAFSDYLDMARDYLIRHLTLTSTGGFQAARVFFHYDWYIGGTDIGNTVLYDPNHKAVVAYKDDAYFLMGGATDGPHGITSWACGKKGGNNQGTWVDAEDGVLGRNPIEQGSVDCVVQFDLPAAAAGEERRLTHWLCMGARFQDVSAFGQDLLLARGEDTYRTRTRTYWKVWSDKEHKHIEEELGAEARGLYRRSVLTARCHVDSGGGIVAATDYDITKFARDTYAYVWPRDGAIVANALDRAGHEDITRKFFNFCADALVDEGYFLHKYTPSGKIGSSWHPWVDAHGNRTLPIQEDETGLVVWALWEHFRIHHNLDFVVDLYSTLVLPAADWMISYVDTATGLPLPSWDLWEERWGVHAFTVGAVHGGLAAALNFAELFGDATAQERLALALLALRNGTDQLLYRPELNRFARRINFGPDGEVEVDQVLDSAIYGLWRFGMYAPDEPRITATMQAIAGELSNKGPSGGQARYANDYYFQVEHDVARTPGNPWFICTLWLAQWYLATARTLRDLKPPQDIINWVVQHQVPGGLLSEQVDPNTGLALSVSPLTWSHAEYVLTVDEYVRRAQKLGTRRALPRRSPARAAGKARTATPPAPEPDGGLKKEVASSSGTGGQ